MQMDEEQNYFLPYSSCISKVEWTDVLGKYSNNRKDFQNIPSVNWKIQLTRTQFPPIYYLTLIYLFYFLNEAQ